MKHVYSIANSYFFRLAKTKVKCNCDCPAGANSCNSVTNRYAQYLDSILAILTFFDYFVTAVASGQIVSIFIAMMYHRKVVFCDF